MEMESLLLQRHTSLHRLLLYSWTSTRRGNARGGRRGEAENFPPSSVVHRFDLFALLCEGESLIVRLFSNWPGD